MRLTFLLAGFLAALALRVGAGEEKIRGVLEKTSRPGACAQITDALSETYYVNKTDQAEKLVAEYVGKNIKVVISGIVEQKENDPAYYFALKSVEKYTPKLPLPPPPPAEPKAADSKTEEKPADQKPTDKKPEEKPAPVSEKK
jgi:CO dehydrogenase/acetyl-CoA synthase gamma subunit (corrinoid Fe-S protein)